MWPEGACSSPALLRWVVEDAAKHVPLPASWWERTICTAAVYSGNEDTLKVARQLGFKLHRNTWMMAAGLGRIDMLELIESDCGLWEEGEPLPSDLFCERVTTMAATYGKLEALVWLLSRGCPFNRDLLVGACSVMGAENYYDVMGYVILHTQQRDDGSWIWHESPIPVALDILDDLGMHENDFPTLRSLTSYDWGF